ncbi:MAG: SDR family oxidoreductase [Polyangiaceae bacterium]
MQQDLRGKVVVITGASAGVGRAIAVELGQRGASVALIARGLDRLQVLQASLRAAGVAALAVVADVSDAKQVETAATQVEAALGPIDVWINNAMVTVLSPVAEMTAREYEQVTRVTYLGVVHGTLSALARMKPRNAGHIIQIGSALAYRAIPLQSAYCAAKHAIRGFTDSLRCELLHDNANIQLTMVQLPAVNTPQFSWCRTRLSHQPQPVPPIYQPEVVARSVAAIVGQDRREVWVGTSTWKTIWGSRFLSGLLDRYLADKGYSGQQTREPIEPDREDNLFEPLSGDYGAHGRFDDRATNSSPAAWLAAHRPTLSALVMLSVTSLLLIASSWFG